MQKASCLEKYTSLYVKMKNMHSLGKGSVILQITIDKSDKS